MKSASIRKTLPVTEASALAESACRATERRRKKNLNAGRTWSPKANFGTRATSTDVKKAIKKPAASASRKKKVKNAPYPSPTLSNLEHRLKFAFLLFLEENIIHRTVSERNRHAQKREKSPKKDKDIPNICNQQCNKLGYFQSTPNVADLKGGHASQTVVKRDKSMYNATSESELLDREILPIFQKLLTERNKSQNNIDYSFGRSCPNISIKCDIVEYL